MAINFIPNDPSAGASAPAMRVQAKRPNRPTTRAGFTFSNTSSEGTFAPGTPAFLFWQCREAALAAMEAWEAAAGTLTRWQGNRRRLRLRQDAGVDLNAYYDRASFSFFHRAIGGTTYFSGASTDVVAHEIGHGLLDAIRPDLWDVPFLEVGAFHEAFGDCVAVLTALNDRQTRQKVLAVTTTLRKKNFLETTAENLSEAIRRLLPSHNAAEPRHAYNNFQFQIPETLPDDGGPGELINEVHSFGMLFSGCFYDLIAAIFVDQSNRTEASLLASAKTAAGLLAEGAATAVVTPRFLQSVGRAMVLADDQLNDGENRDRIRAAFQRHAIMLGANALLAPTAVLEGTAPALGRTATLATATRRDLRDRLGLTAGGRVSIESAGMSGRRFLNVVHTQPVGLGSLNKALRGVTIGAPLPVLVGNTGGHPAIMGELPEIVSTEREVQAFVQSLLDNGQIQLGKTSAAAARDTRTSIAATSATSRRAAKKSDVLGATHRVALLGKKKVLVRVRFQCERCS